MRAKRHGAAIVRTGAAWAYPLAELVLASAANLEGDGASAAEILVRSASGFAVVGMGLHEVVARRARGLVVGGGEGRALVEAADGWLAEQGVKVPARFAAMIAPGFVQRAT
jgi:hypothetical protein